jgi:competence protein ComEC
MPLLWLSLAFLAGIALAGFLWAGPLPADSLPVSLTGWLLLAALGLLLLLLRPVARLLNIHFPALTRPHIPVPLAALLLAFALGGARYAAAQPDLDDPSYIAFYNHPEATYRVTGVLLAPPEASDRYVRLRLSADKLFQEEQGIEQVVHGSLLVTDWDLGDWRYGDRLEVTGLLEDPPEGEGFSYRGYLARQGIYSTMQPEQIERLGSGYGNPLLAALYRLRERLLALTYQFYPDPEASLLAGILLGIESGISPDVKKAFQDSGTAHIIAISGFNIAILSALFATLFSRLLGRWRGAITALACIAVYTLLVGAGASVVRAALMGGLTLFAVQLGRRQDGFNTLAIVALIMALLNPNVLWDVGFQLSFLATLGLVLYAGALSQGFVSLAGRRLPPVSVQKLARPVSEYVLFTLAASLTTLPVILYHFGRLSLVSLIANPAILPAQPPLMVLGGISLLLGLLFEPLGRLAAALTLPFAAYTVRAAEIFASIPGSALPVGKVSLGWVVLFYGLLFGLTFFGRRVRTWLAARVGGRPLPATAMLAVALVGLGIAAALVWRGYLSAPDGRLHLTILDVGSGDALLVKTPSGRYLLIDGGPSASLLSDALGRRLPSGRRQLDWLVVAAAGDEQTAALAEVVQRYPPEQVLWAGPSQGSRSARRLQEELAQMELQPIPAEAGQGLDLGDGARLEVLAAGKRGAVLWLEWEDFRALLPVGLDFDTLEMLGDDPHLRNITALLLAESGYAPANPPGWINRLHPEVVLLSVAAGDRDGRPSPETLEAVRDYSLLRTDRNGWIELTTDGEQMWVEAENK